MKKWWASIWFSFCYGTSCIPSALALSFSPKLLPIASLFGWSIWVIVIAVIKMRIYEKEQKKRMSELDLVPSDKEVDSSLLREVHLKESLKEYAEEFHNLAAKNGFWDDDPSDGEKIALMHSELSEVLESLRKGDGPDDKIPDFKGSEAELADCIIRILDFSHKKGLRIAEAMIAKHEYNKTRPFRHGKEF